MNILFLSTTYPTPARPRQGTFNQNLVAALRGHHDVRVIAPIPWGQLRSKTRVDPNGKLPDTPDSRDLHPTYYYTPKLFRNHYHQFYWRSILPALGQLQKSFQPDLVIGYWLHPDGAAALRAAQYFDTPCIAVSGGSDLRRLPANPGRRRAVQQVLAQVDRLVVVSRDLAEVAIALGMPASQIDVVYRGVDRDRFQPSDRDQARDACQVPRDSVVLLWTGRFEAVKNPQMLLRAASRWQDHWGDRLRVLIAGDGSMHRELLKLRSQLALENSVRFEGNLSQEDLALRYNAADATVLTSHSEGIPNVLLESISCGTPFVATDVGGVAEITSHHIDRLVADGDQAALVKAVIEQVESSTADSSGGVNRRFIPDGLAEMAMRFERVFERTFALAPSESTKAAR